MIPLGYMLKRVAGRLANFAADIDDICALSACLSPDFADYVGHWRHNGFWLFDAPQTMRDIAATEGIDLAGTTLFYYETFPQQFDAKTRQWSDFGPDPSLPTRVVPPQSRSLCGYDVTCFSSGTAPECSPLSCNGLAAELPVNRHCLFDSFEAAKRALEEGRFDGSGPGPFRIMRSIRPPLELCALRNHMAGRPADGSLAL